MTEVEVDIDEPDPVNQTAGEMIRRAENIVVDIPPEYDWTESVSGRRPV
jgi:hypothetical protein